MKWLIASDIHGSARYCRELLAAYDREEADRLLLLGDILYHGPRNDLPDEYNPKEVFRLLNERRETILCVRGNCDSEVDQMVLAFPIMADYSIVEAEGVRMFVTHGHLYHTINVLEKEEKLPPLSKGDILLHGHTHVPVWENHGDFWYLNPGSVSIPKNDSPRGYMILENGVFIWKQLDGEVYHTLKL